MKSAAIALLFVSISAVSGCATDVVNRSISERASAQLIPGKVLTSPIKSVASVGDVMLTAGEYATEPTQTKLAAIRIDKTISVAVKHRQHTFEFQLPPGDYLLAGKSDEGLFYGAPNPLLEHSGRIGYGGIFVPHTLPATATEIFWVWVPKAPLPGDFYSAKLSSPVPVNPKDLVRRLNDGVERGPQATLTYAGVAGGQIRFVYKEFTAEGLARAAFTQEVGLDYKPGELYAYKNARFTVEKADTTHIEFTLINGL